MAAESETEPPSRRDVAPSKRRRAETLKKRAADLRSRQAPTPDAAQLINEAREERAEQIERALRGDS